MQPLLFRLIINAIALYVATLVVPGMSFFGDQNTTAYWGTVFVVALIFGVVNALVRPVLTVLTCPLLILTLGLFTFVINALMLVLTAWIARQLHLAFRVDGFGAALIGAIVVSIVSFLLTLFVREEK
jgi:putative membrane protein